MSNPCLISSQVILTCPGVSTHGCISSLGHLSPLSASLKQPCDLGGRRRLLVVISVTMEKPAALWARRGCCLKLIPLGFQMLFSGRREDRAVVDLGSPSSTLRCPFCPSLDAQFLQAAGRTASWGAGLWFLHKELISSITSRWPSWATPFLSQCGVNRLPRWPFPAAPTCQCRSLRSDPRVRKSPWRRACILAWKIPWTEEPGGLQSIESHKVRHNWSDLAHTHVGLASRTGGSGCPVPFLFFRSDSRTLVAGVEGATLGWGAFEVTPVPWTSRTFLLRVHSGSWGVEWLIVIAEHRTSARGMCV